MALGSIIIVIFVVVWTCLRFTEVLHWWVVWCLNIDQQTDRETVTYTGSSIEDDEATRYRLEKEGEEAIESANYEKAATLFGKLLESPKCLVLRSFCFCEMGKYHEAADDAILATQLTPTYDKAWIAAGIASMQLNRQFDAILYFKKGHTHLMSRTLQKETLLGFENYFKMLGLSECKSFIDILDSDDEASIQKYIDDNSSEVTQIITEIVECAIFDASMVSPWVFSSGPVDYCDATTFVLSRIIQVVPGKIVAMSCVSNVVAALRDAVQIGWHIHHGIAKYAAYALTILATQDQSQHVSESALNSCFSFISAWLRTISTEQDSDEPVVPVCGCPYLTPRFSALTWLERVFDEPTMDDKVLEDSFLSHHDCLTVLVRAVAVTRDERVSSICVPIMLSKDFVVEWVVKQSNLITLHLNQSTNQTGNTPPPTPLPQWILDSLMYLVSSIDITDNSIFTPVACTAIRKLSFKTRCGVQPVLKSWVFKPFLMALSRLASVSQPALKLLGDIAETKNGGEQIAILRDVLLKNLEDDSKIKRKHKVPSWIGLWNETNIQFTTMFTTTTDERTDTDETMSHPLIEAWNLAEVLNRSESTNEDNKKILSELTAKMGPDEQRQWLIRRNLRDLSPEDLWEQDDTVFVEATRGGDILDSVITMMTNKVGLGSNNLQNVLEVRFTDESSIGSAVAREWADLVAQQVFCNPENLILSQPDSCPSHYIPNPVRKFTSPTWEKEFVALGRLLSLSLWHRITIDLPLHPAVWSLILGCDAITNTDDELTLKDNKKLEWLQNNPVDSIGVDLYFSDMIHQGPTDHNNEAYYHPDLHILSEGDVKRTVDGLIYEELVPGGQTLKITEGNKKVYLDILEKRMELSGVKRELAAVKRGFHAIFSEKVLQDAREYVTGAAMCHMVSGVDVLDIVDWEKNSVVTGFSGSASKVVEFFWAVLKTFSQDQLKKILQYTTGSRRVPHGGFACLVGYNGGRHKFTLSHGSHLTPDSYPTAHACICTLDLPPWKDLETTAKKLQDLTIFESFRFDEHAD